MKTAPLAGRVVGHRQFISRPGAAPRLRRSPSKTAGSGTTGSRAAMGSEKGGRSTTPGTGRGAAAMNRQRSKATKGAGRRGSRTRRPMLQAVPARRPTVGAAARLGVRRRRAAGGGTSQLASGRLLQRHLGAGCGTQEGWQQECGWQAVRVRMSLTTYGEQHACSVCQQPGGCAGRSHLPTYLGQQRHRMPAAGG